MHLIEGLEAVLRRQIHMHESHTSNLIYIVKGGVIHAIINELSS
jgi:hypothetical protein